MRAAIQVRFLAPTTHRGARMKAWRDAPRGAVRTREYPYNYGESTDMNYSTAAARFAREIGWDWRLVGGRLPNGDYAFVDAAG